MKPHRTCIAVCLLMLVLGPAAWANSPPREEVKEVKFHAGYKAQLMAIEGEACDHYSRTGEFKVFQQKSNPRPGDVKTVNFGYSCVNPKNPRGGWFYLESIEGELASLVGATEEAKAADKTNAKAGQVIADEVFHYRRNFFRRDIFPEFLPRDSSPEYMFWTYGSRPNPKRMEIHVYRQEPPHCPDGLAQGRLADGRTVCYDYPLQGQTNTKLAWHDDTVFEKYSNEITRPELVPENALVLVSPPDVAVVKEDSWKYVKPPGQP